MPDLSDPALRVMAHSILTSLAIVKQEDGLCSYPTETAQFTYERACFEVTRWLRRLREAQREQSAKYLEEMAKGYDYIPERISSEDQYDAPSFASGYKLACRSIASFIRRQEEGR